MRFIIVLLICFISSSPILGQGFIFTTPDKYEKIGTAQMPIGGGDIPDKVDLSENMPPPGNQEKQNSCVAWAIAYACKSYQEKEKNNYSYYKGDGQLDYSKVFSPSFLYNLINEGRNMGTSFEDACNILIKYGVCTWQSMPYNPNDWLTQPNNRHLEEAGNFKIETYRRIDLNNLTANIKAQLLKKIPVITATVIDRNYHDKGYNTVSNPYVWRIKGPVNQGMGHAVLIVGYDDSLNAFKFINSWGDNWGNNGYGWLSYDIASSVIKEAYIIKSPFNSNYLVEANENPLSKDNNILDATDINKFGLSFNISNVMHEANVPNAKMTIQGTIQIPRNIGRSAQIVINFYVNNSGIKGPPVGSLDHRFALLTGQAATGTSPVQLQPNIDLNTIWTLYMPYVVFNIPRGQMTPWGYRPAVSHLLAEPVLFIDNFPVRIGQIFPFAVSL